MATEQPNRVPRRGGEKLLVNVGAARAEPLSSRDIRGNRSPSGLSWSNFRAGHRIPATVVVIHEPWQLTVESDCAAIPDTARSEACHGTSQHSSPNCRTLFPRCQMQLDWGSGQQSMGGLYERAAGRDVDQRHVVTEPDARAHDAVLFGRVTASRAAPFRWSIAHRGFQRRSCGSNLRIRVLPVSPKTRMTY